jgi:hypothetical protein
MTVDENREGRGNQGGEQHQCAHRKGECHFGTRESNSSIFRAVPRNESSTIYF